MKKHILMYLYIFTGLVLLSFFVNGIEVHAENLEKNGLVKVNTQDTDVETEIYLDESLLDNAQIYINDVGYVIKNRKLVKDQDNSLVEITPFAKYKITFTLKNGQSGLSQRDALKGTPMNWTSYGPKELRMMSIIDKNGKKLGDLKGKDWGVGMTITAPYTGLYGFRITNYSSSTQTWNCEIRF